MSINTNSKLNFSKAQKNYNQFIDHCFQPGEGYRLTPNSEVSPYALCFAIFGKHLLCQMDSLSKEIKLFDQLLRFNLSSLKKKSIENRKNIQQDKGYLQLLCFTLSSLEIIGTLSDNSLEAHVAPLLDERNLLSILEKPDIYSGTAGTGNLAMFYAILIIYSKNYLKIDKSGFLDIWIDKHISSMNSNGFWGLSDRKLYLQFQNGYHQYEIFEYLGIKNERQSYCADLIYSLSDNNGHFAPYPGGGSCYDYDAIFMITFLGNKSSKKFKPLLFETLNTILSEQNIDGGFSESLYIRPRNFKNFKIMLSHLLEKNGVVRFERARICFSLLRPKHNNIKTHWTIYSREWNESNLWDSWFRMLTVARIDNYISLSPSKWGFINFPGIGFNYSLNKD